MNQLSSTQNPLVKYLFALTQKSKERKLHNEFLIEGKREITLAIGAHYRIKQIFFTPSICPLEEVEASFKGYPITEISSQVYEKLSYRSSTEGVLALAESKAHNIGDLFLQKPSPLLLVAEAPEKPGNIGALLRTADAAGIDGVCIANPKTDLYNPNIIRASIGTVFTTPIAVGSTKEILHFLCEKSFTIYCAALSASVPYDSVSYQNPTAIVVGTEDEGLSKDWLEASFQNIIIPMNGKIDSMNVSVSAGILVFEALRQRKNS